MRPFARAANPLTLPALSEAAKAFEYGVLWNGSIFRTAKRKRELIDTLPLLPIRLENLCRHHHFFGTARQIRRHGHQHDAAADVI